MNLHISWPDSENCGFVLKTLSKSLWANLWTSRRGRCSSDGTTTTLRDVKTCSQGPVHSGHASSSPGSETKAWPIHIFLSSWDRLSAGFLADGTRVGRTLVSMTTWFTRHACKNAGGEEENNSDGRTKKRRRLRVRSADDDRPECENKWRVTGHCGRGRRRRFCAWWIDRPRIFRRHGFRRRGAGGGAGAVFSRRISARAADEPSPRSVLLRGTRGVGEMTRNDSFSPHYVVYLYCVIGPCCATVDVGTQTIPRDIGHDFFQCSYRFWKLPSVLEFSNVMGTRKHASLTSDRFGRRYIFPTTFFF